MIVTPIVTCTISDTSGDVAGSICGGGGLGEIDIGGTPQSWGVHALGGGHVIASPPYTASLTLSGYASFSIPIVVLGGSGSAYLWYHTTEFRSEHFGNASLNVTFGNAGGVSANVSAPCLAGPRPGEQLSWDCYIPFTFGAPLTLTESGTIDGHLTGDGANDYAEYDVNGTLMGIVSQPGSHNLTAQDAIIVQMPEPAMLPALMILAPIGFLARRRRRQ